jgi:hypothetical protein
MDEETQKDTRQGCNNAPFNNQPRKRKWEPKTKLHKNEDPKNKKQDIVKKQVSRHPTWIALLPP